jgi:hypothetical protein
MGILIGMRASYCAAAPILPGFQLGGRNPHSRLQEIWREGWVSA